MKFFTLSFLFLFIIKIVVFRPLGLPLVMPWLPPKQGGRWRKWETGGQSWAMSRYCEKGGLQNNHSHLPLPHSPTTIFLLQQMSRYCEREGSLWRLIFHLAHLQFLKWWNSYILSKPKACLAIQPWWVPSYSYALFLTGLSERYAGWDTSINVEIFWGGGGVYVGSYFFVLGSLVNYIFLCIEFS